MNVTLPECSICLVEVSTSSETDLKESCTLVECRHTFHTKCILPWLLSSASCPNCRQPSINKEQMDTAIGCFKTTRVVNHLVVLIDNWFRAIGYLPPYSTQLVQTSLSPDAWLLIQEHVNLDIFQFEFSPIVKCNYNVSECKSEIDNYMCALTTIKKLIYSGDKYEPTLLHNFLKPRFLATITIKVPLVYAMVDGLIRKKYGRKPPHHPLHIMRELKVLGIDMDFKFPLKNLVHQPLLSDSFFELVLGIDRHIFTPSQPPHQAWVSPLITSSNHNPC